MGVEDSWGAAVAPPPAVVVPSDMERDEQWRHFDNSVNAVSFGFVATAILISMFLVMAIFERFLRPRSSLPSSFSSATTRPYIHDHDHHHHPHQADLEAPVLFHGKLAYPSPKMTFYSKGVSVLMPGENTPTFLAHPAPPSPCPPEPIVQPLHQHTLASVSSLLQNPSWNPNLR
ncbi:hypothetical protein Tsubulata_050723 [Turnera subulata]|uniref:Uncharacterized protein n=1 Tax=Turnera subulata TaxID=218843 RepID=A0A9Q0FZ85_9ROSI|nr:hypothetical protein Tsubulata_050723 [Turnera subulata]